MKTNHQRGFKAKKHADKAMQGWSEKSLFSGTAVSAYIGNDFSKGRRGMAKAVKGAKKYVRSRIRAKDKMHMKKVTCYEEDA